MNLVNFMVTQEIISQLIKKHEDTISFPDEWTQSYKWYNRKGKDTIVKSGHTNKTQMRKFVYFMVMTKSCRI